MGVFFGLLSALSITTAEFFSRRVTNEIGPLVAASSASLVATAVAVAVAVIGGGSPTPADLAYGALSGVCFGAGLAAYLQGVLVSTSAVVGPSTAALATLIPFAYAGVRDVAPSALAVLGALVIVLGLVLVTSGGSEASNVAQGFPLGLASGLAYGVGTAVLIEVSSDAGSWPIVSQRTAAFVAVTGYALARHRPVVPPRHLAGPAIGGGVFAGLSSIVLLLGLGFNAAATSVTATLFPASSAIAGRMFFGDAVSRTQAVGLVVVVVGTIVIAIA